MRDKKLLLYRDQNQKLLALRLAQNRLLAVHVYDEADTVSKGDIYIGKLPHVMPTNNAAVAQVPKR